MRLRLQPCTPPSAAHADAHPGVHAAADRSRLGFSLIEMLVVLAIICTLMALLFPVIHLLRESARKQQARSVVAQIATGLSLYASEDPTRSYPPQDPDTLVRTDPSHASFHVIDALILIHEEAGLHPLVNDPDNPGWKVLVDPWQRPYRYQLDTANNAMPNQKVTATRPDPARTDWNTRNLVPFGYIWSLGSPVQGHPGEWSGDPDAQAGTNAPWIYPTTAPATASTLSP